MTYPSTRTLIAKFSSHSKDSRSKTALLLMVALIISFVAPAAAHRKTTKKPKSSSAAVPKSKITITYPENNVTASGGFVDLEYKADEEIKAFKVKVTTETDGYSGPVSTQSVRLFLFKGKNTIKLTGYKEGVLVPDASAEIVATCNRGCIEEVSPLGGAIHPIGQEVVENQEQKPPKTGVAGGAGGSSPRNISIRVPSDAPIDASTIEPTVVLQEKSGIKSIFVQVYNNGQLIDKGSSHKVDYQEGLGIVPVKVRLASGTNSIQAFDPSHIGEAGYSEVAQVNCAGEKCKSGAATETPAKKNITILQPPGGLTVKDVTAIDLYLNISKGSNISHLVSEVYKDGKRVAVNDPINVPDSADKDIPITPRVSIVKGDNRIRFLDPDHAGDVNYEASVKVTCSGDKCSQSAATATAANEEPAITIDQPDPKKPETVDTPVIDAYLTIAEGSKIEKLKYEISKGEEVVFTSQSIDVKADPDKKRPKRVEVKILSGTNTVTFFDAADRENVKHRASFKIECSGDHCPANFDIAKFPSNGQNSRVVVGIEQAGGSSAESTSKPFIDFFFTTPFIFDKDNCEKKNADGTPNEKYQQCIDERDHKVRTARFGFWGQVRIASSPAQIANAEVLPSSLVNQVGNASNVVELVQSFDFLAGAEGRLKTSNGNFLSLIPGLRQRTSFYVAGGAGAISPLESTKEAVQIFKIPGDGDPQRAEFIRRYGTPPPGKNNVAFLPLDRDRFFRQWYAGIRLKTHYCENYSCSQYINSFPAIVDFMFGQNESVTGGSLFYFKQTDPNDPSKTKKKRAFVFRLDAFYPFPIKEANFLYFYGSAVLKVGAGGVSVQNPLFLDRVDSAKLSDTDLFIPSVDIQKQRLPNRDYYKIGVGINLTELFNRNKGTRQ